PEDAVEIARVVRESYRGFPATHVPADMPNFYPENIAAALKDSATQWRALCVDGKTAAVAMWRLIPGMAHLPMLFVDCAHQGPGFGSKLLKMHQEEAKKEQKDTRLYTLHCLGESMLAVR